jgi:predicted nucleotidyltransferase
VAESSSAVVATTPKGNSLKIGQVKNFAYRQREWQGEEQPITVALVKNRGREVPLVTVEGNALGVLDRESEVKLRERNLLIGKGFTFVARLENSPPTAAQVRVKPETVFYPWRQQEQERQLEAKRAQYREKYEVYAAQVFNNSAFRGAARQEVDVEVAILAQAETNNPHEVAIILSQSDQVREWRASVPDSRSWEEYVQRAKEYFRVIQYTAIQRQQLATMKSQEVSR